MQASDLKGGDLIKCRNPHERFHSFGIVVKITRPQPYNDPAESATWAWIQWHDGHRTWEEMECSLEHNLEVISESR